MSTRVVLPLRTLSTIFVPFFRRLAERSVTVTLPLLLYRVADLRVPATRSVPNSVAVVRAGVSRVMVQVTAFLDDASRHAVRTVSPRAGAGAPAGPGRPAGPGAPGAP